MLVGGGEAPGAAAGEKLEASLSRARASPGCDPSGERMEHVMLCICGREDIAVTFRVGCPGPVQERGP